MPLVIALLALVGFGCGASDEDSTMSRAAFIASGNDICSKTSEEGSAAYEKVSKELAGSQTTDSVKEKEQEFADEVASVISTMVDEFEELDPPAGRAARISTMLEQYKKGAENTKTNPSSFLKGEAFLAADKSAKELGLTNCEHL